tara:strand:- start:104 stop:451 length:348 start_codon:yes stop_codon:yes gene_type:complete
MAKDPYQIEKEVNSFISDRKDWMVGKKFSSLNRDAFELKMQEKYAYLFVSSKIIFDKCISGDLDNKHQKKQLDDMLNYLKQIHDGTRTQDEVEKEFGQKLADKYVNPVVENLDKK